MGWAGARLQLFSQGVRGGGADKNRCIDERDAGSTNNRGGCQSDRPVCVARRRRRHLYLAIDDWPWGYSVYKVDLSTESDADADQPPPHQQPPAAVSGTEQRRELPPAFFRVEADRYLSGHFAAAFGTKILALHPTERGTDTRSMVPVPVPVMDVREMNLILGPRPRPDPADPIYIPVSDRLFVLGAGSFRLLGPPPSSLAGSEVWSWRRLPRLPFKSRHVTSHALHPDGRTIFASVGRRRRATAATFTFDTAGWDSSDDAGLERHGEWALPFAGRAFFDSKLDAWVGLSKDSLGHLCSCDVVAPAISSGAGDGPPRKLSKEKLFDEDPADEGDIGATLVYMGGDSRFCLAQYNFVLADDSSSEDEGYCDDFDVPEQLRFVLRLTMFSLKYDKNGDLTTGDSRRVRCYDVPEHATVIDRPEAFWM